MAMDKKYMKCNQHLPLIEATKLLLGVGRRNLMVTDEKDRMLGTVSVSDILRFLIDSNSDWPLIPVKDIMETDYIFLRERYSKSDAVKLFIEKRLDYIPILGDDHKVVGIEFVQDYL